MTNVDDDLRAITAGVHVLSRSLRRNGEARVDLAPLPGSEFEVLGHLGARPGSSVSEIARALGLQVSNVSTTVRNLVERGLVDRVPDPHDQRRINLWRSAAADRQRGAVEAAWSAELARLIDMLPAQDAERLLAAAPALRQLADLITADHHRPARVPGGGG